MTNTTGDDSRPIEFHYRVDPSQLLAPGDNVEEPMLLEGPQRLGGVPFMNGLTYHHHDDAGVRTTTIEDRGDFVYVYKDGRVTIIDQRPKPEPRPWWRRLTDRFAMAK